MMLQFFFSNKITIKSIFIKLKTGWQILATLLNEYDIISETGYRNCTGNTGCPDRNTVASIKPHICYIHPFDL